MPLKENVVMLRKLQYQSTSEELIIVPLVIVNHLKKSSLNKDQESLRLVKRPFLIATHWSDLIYQTPSSQLIVHHSRRSSYLRLSLRLVDMPFVIADHWSKLYFHTQSPELLMMPFMNVTHWYMHIYHNHFNTLVTMLSEHRVCCRVNKYCI